MVTGAGPSRREAPAGIVLWSALLAIFVVAAAVRFWRIGWGLEHQLAFADEVLVWPKYLFGFLPPSWDSLFGKPLPYPPLYGYLAGLSVAGAHAIGVIGPRHDLFDALLVARMLSAAVSLAAVAVVYQVGARAYGRCAGLLGAALLASFPRAALQTHYASVDELLVLTIALTLLAAYVLTVRRTPLVAFGCGVCVALAGATKWNGLLIAVCPLWALLEIALAERSVRRVVVLGAAFAAGVLLVLPIACPPCWLETDRVLESLGALRHLSASTTWRPPTNHLSPELGWYGRPFLYQLVAGLPFALGTPAYLVCVLGVAVALRRRTPADRVVLIGLVAWFVFIGRMEVTFQRYLEPLLPILAVLGGRGLAALRLPAAATVGIATAVVAYGVLLGGSQVARMSFDQQLGVAQWIATNYARGERARLRVAVPITKPAANWLQLDAPLRRVGVKLQKLPPERWLDDRPDVFILPEWFATSVRRDPARAALRDDLDRLEAGESGYREAARFDEGYFNDGFYTWLDPGFASDLWMGAIGFRVYVPGTKRSTDTTARIR